MRFWLTNTPPIQQRWCYHQSNMSNIMIRCNYPKSNNGFPNTPLQTSSNIQGPHVPTHNCITDIHLFQAPNQNPRKSLLLTSIWSNPIWHISRKEDIPVIFFQPQEKKYIMGEWLLIPLQISCNFELWRLCKENIRCKNGFFNLVDAAIEFTRNNEYSVWFSRKVICLFQTLATFFPVLGSCSRYIYWL